MSLPVFVTRLEGIARWPQSGSVKPWGLFDGAGIDRDVLLWPYPTLNVETPPRFSRLGGADVEAQPGAAHDVEVAVVLGLKSVAAEVG